MKRIVIIAMFCASACWAQNRFPQTAARDVTMIPFPEAVTVDMALYFPMDRTGKMTNNYTPTGLDMNLIEAVFTESGYVRGGMWLDGTNDYVSIADDNAFTPTGTNASITVSCWILATSTSALKTVVSKDRYATGANRSWTLNIKAGGVVQWLVSETASGNEPRVLMETTGTIAPDTWHHVCGRYDGLANKGDVWIDGVEDPTSESQALAGLYNNTQPVRIGANSNGATVSEYFGGRIDEVLFWPRALTDAEIEDLYARFVVARANQ